MERGKTMKCEEILKHIDHTLLKQTATWEQIKALCNEGMENQVASICIPPSYVKQAKELVGETGKICTVIGFPNGYTTTATKVFETQDAIQRGADEIDMVINIGWLKDGLYDDILEEINAIKGVCGEKILKVIVETCFLTEAEKKRICQIVMDSKGDYIKTSTGFGGGGATKEDIQLFSDTITNATKIKAAGGIKSVGDAVDFLQAGAQRLGSSSLVGMIRKKMENR